MQLKIGPAMRAALAARNLDIYAYQPIALFRETRKLALVPQPGDPWRVILRHKGMCSWGDGATAGQAVGDTLDEAIEHALGHGDVLGAMKRLGAALDGLTGVLRA